MEMIGRYRILRRLGGGGFGEVFLGEDAAMGRQVAIKVFRPKDENLIAFATSSAEEGLQILRQRFLNEARILASLEDEPHIVNVHDYGNLPDGAPYYVMPYLPHSLADEIGKDVFDVSALEELPEAQRPRALPLDHALPLIEQLLMGLAAAHQRGLIHRDIKPSNLMLNEPGQLRIVDFGIAKAPDGQHSTVSHLGMGSRNYMAPEQRESAKHVDPRADIHAAGIVAYRMLTGRLPLGRFPDPNVAVPALGQPLNDLLLAMLAVDKQERPDDGNAALARFHAALGQVSDAGGNDTGTWVSGGEAGVRDELKPLRARITELIGEHGVISTAHREGLVALAAIADLTEDDLDPLIDEVVASDKTLVSKQRLARLIEERASKATGALPEESLASWEVAAQAVGWERSHITAIVGRVLAARSIREKSNQKHPELKHAQTQVKPTRALTTAQPTSSRKPWLVVAPVLVLILVAVAAGLDVDQWRQVRIEPPEQAGQKQHVVAATERPAGLPREEQDQISARARKQVEATASVASERWRINAIQSELRRLGRDIVVDGAFGAHTAAHIRAFEEAAQLPIEGNPTEVLLAELKQHNTWPSRAKRDQAISLDTSTQRLSYGIAYGLGQRMSSDGIQLDVQQFKDGLRDGVTDKEAKLSEEEMGAAMLAQQSGEAMTPDSRRRLSYAIAYGLGQRMLADDVPIDVPAFTAGLQDALEGSKPRITEEEIQEEMMAYQQRAMEEQKRLAAGASHVNQAAAKAFLAENATRKGVIVTRSGLQYEVIRAGSGPRPGPVDIVEVHYRGTLVDGTEFDSSYERGETVTFGVDQVIEGWTEALQLMSPGAKWNLYIPADLAYGSGGAGNLIGPDAALVFEVELISVSGRDS